jgi:hypothetical protein
MELGLFPAENGYLESIMRGLRLSFLKEENYAQIRTLGTLNDLKQVCSSDQVLGRRD